MWTLHKPIFRHRMCWGLTLGYDNPNRNCLQKPCSADSKQTCVHPSCHCISKKQPKQRDLSSIKQLKSPPSLQKLEGIWSLADVFDSNVTTAQLSTRLNLCCVRLQSLHLLCRGLFDSEAVFFALNRGDSEVHLGWKDLEPQHCCTHFLPQWPIIMPR